MPPVIKPELCTGCNRCVDRCPEDVFESGTGKEDAIIALHPKSPKGARVPFVKYPNECWHCGICTIECPYGAITWKWPPAMEVAVLWVK